MTVMDTALSELMATHGGRIEAQLEMGFKGDSGEGCEQSNKVPSKVQGKAAYACEGCMGVHGGAWGGFGKLA
jgi:hypothetical protein